MYWEEAKRKQRNTVPDDVIDVVFGIACRTLPVDHAYSLSQAVCKELSWSDDEPNAAVHTIHVAASGNGWYRPDTGDQLLYPSRRTKLALRIPKHRIDDAQSLSGKTLDIEGHELTVKDMSQKMLSEITTLFARYVVGRQDQEEMDFLADVKAALDDMDIQPKKMLCGIESTLESPHGPLVARSLMIADLTFDESIKLQQQGLGDYQWMGCGIFLPHKDINEIGETQG
jgi:CRISPR-associated protein Cas6